MDEDTVTTTVPEPSPAPEPAPEPSPPPVPEPAPAPSEPEPSNEPGMTVVSVDELVDRLIQSTEPGEEENPEEPTPDDSEQLPEDGEPGDVFMEVDTGPLEIKGMDKLLKHAETIQQTLDHPLMTTSFQDYTVTEGLLLLILLTAFAAVCVKILKGGFQWLRW